MAVDLNDCLSRFNCMLRDDGSNCHQCNSAMGITTTERIKMATDMGLVTSGDMYEEDAEDLWSDLD